LKGRGRAIGFLSAIEDACAEQILPCPGGHAILDPRHAGLWDANLLRVETAVAPDGAALIAAAETLLGALGFRMITVLHDSAARELSGPLVASDYELDHQLLMILADDVSATEPAVSVTEVDLVTLHSGRVVAAVERHGGGEVGHQLASRDSLIASAVALRCFAVLEDDEIVARCQLYTDGDIAQVENVYAHPGHRRQGFADALVSHAVSQARAGGARLIFLVADADDWPQRLYRRLGFRDAGLLHRFRRMEP